MELQETGGSRVVSVYLHGYITAPLVLMLMLMLKLVVLLLLILIIHKQSSVTVNRLISERSLS